MKFEDKLNIVVNIDKYIPGKTINTITQKDEIIIDGKVFKVGSFLSEQRKIYAKYEKMTDDKKKSKEVLDHFRQLEELGFDFNPKETDWQKKYKALCMYKEKYKDINVPYSYEITVDNEVIQLGVFVSNQRVTYRRYQDKKVKEDEKTLEHFRLLEELGIEWEPQEADFKKKYKACKQYFEIYGNLELPENYVVIVDDEEIDIGVFIANQRGLYNKYQAGNITRTQRSNMVEHFKMLEEIGMNWDLMEASWQKKYQLLVNYKTRHGHTNIKADYTEMVDGETVNLGLFLDDQRSLYRKHKDNIPNNKQGRRLKEHFKLLENLGIDFEPRETYWKIRYNLLKEYKEINGDINVPTDYIIELDKEKIKLGKFLSKQRELYRQYEENNFLDCPEYLQNHFKLLNELGISWNPTKDEFIKQYNYLKKYYDMYKNIDIDLKYVIYDNGKKIKLGQIARNIKEAISKRKDEILDGSAPIEIMHKYHILKEIGFTFTNPVDMITYNFGEGPKQYTRKELSKKLNIPYKTFNMYVKRFNGNVTKTYRIYMMNQKLKKQKQSKKSEHYNLANLMESFDVNLERLDQYLEKKILIDKVKRQSEVVMYSPDVSLRKYCIDHGYNYNIIIRALRLKQKELVDEDLETLINRVIIDYNKHGQNKTPSWVYSKYGNKVLLSHFLTSLRLDATAVIRDMGHNCITIEEAIENNVFKLNNRKKYDYLEPLYHNIVNKFNELNEKNPDNKELIIETISDYINDISQEHHLSETESTFVQDTFFKYRSTINEYHIYDVGFEKDEETKIKKIRKYNLSDEEIKESFFVPLNFDEKVLIGRDSELYQRRYLLKQIIDNIDTYSDKELKDKKEQLGITNEEEVFINNFSNEYNEIKENMYKS